MNYCVRAPQCFESLDLFPFDPILEGKIWLQHSNNTQTTKRGQYLLLKPCLFIYFSPASASGNGVARDIIQSPLLFSASSSGVAGWLRGLSVPETVCNFPPQKVVRCLMHPYHRHFCRLSWLSPLRPLAIRHWLNRSWAQIVFGILYYIQSHITKVNSSSLGLWHTWQKPAPYIDSRNATQFLTTLSCKSGDRFVWHVT